MFSSAAALCRGRGSAGRRRGSARDAVRDGSRVPRGNASASVGSRRNRRPGRSGGGGCSFAARAQLFQIHRITMTAIVSTRVLPPTAVTIGFSRHRLRGTGAWKRWTQDMQRQARSPWWARRSSSDFHGDSRQSVPSQRGQVGMMIVRSCVRAVVAGRPRTVSMNSRDYIDRSGVFVDSEITVDTKGQPCEAALF